MSVAVFGINGGICAALAVEAFRDGADGRICVQGRCYHPYGGHTGSGGEDAIFACRACANLG